MTIGTSTPRNNTLSIIPQKTICITTSRNCYPIAGKSEYITNISIKQENGTHKTKKFFTQLCNFFRRDAGQEDLPLIFFNPKRIEHFQAQLQEQLNSLKSQKFSFVQSGQEVPDVIKEKTEHGYLISPSLNVALESKITTARAGEILSNSEKREPYIKEFLDIKGITDQKFIQELKNSVTRSIIPTGVIKTETPEEATQQIKNLLKKYKDIGIVFQVNGGAGGFGTVLLNKEKIKQILETPEYDILGEFSNIMHYEKYFEGTLVEDIQKNGLSWQKMSSGKEVSAMFRSHSKTKQIEMAAASIMFVGDHGNHLGNIITSPQQLNKIADVSLDEKQIELFTLTHELMLHTMLKLSGYKKGINEIYEEGGSNLKAFASDTFFSTENGVVKHEISEFNARPAGSANAIVSAESIGIGTPFMRISTPFTLMSKEVLSALKNIEPEGAHEFFKQKFDPILKPFQGAFIDTFYMIDKSTKDIPEESIQYRWSIIFPDPDIKTQGKEERAAMEKIYKICQNLTVKEIVDGSRLIGEKRKRD